MRTGLAYGVGTASARVHRCQLAGMSLLTAIALLLPCPPPAVAEGVPWAARVRVDPAIKGSAAEVRLLIHARQRGEADTLAQRLLAEAERRHGPESVETAEELDLLVDALDIFYWYLRPERLERARPLVARAIAIKEAKLALDDSRLAPSLDNMAMVAWLDGDTTRARNSAERARAIREKVYGTDHAEYAKSLRLLGQIAQRSGNVARARELLLQALAIQERTLDPEDLEIVETLAKLQQLGFTTGGSVEESVSLMRRMLATLESRLGSSQYYTLYWMRWLGQLLIRSEPEEAKPLLERALALGEVSLGPGHRLVARTHADLIEYQLLHFDPAAARALADRAVSRYPDDLYLLYRASMMYEVLGDYARAAEVAQQTVTALEHRATREARVTDTLMVLSNRGYYAMLAGDYLGAERFLMRAKRTCDSLPESNDPSDALLREARVLCGDVLGILAELRASGGDVRAADELFGRAVKEVARECPPGSWGAWYVSWHRWKYGSHLLQRGDARAALVQFEQAARGLAESGMAAVSIPLCMQGQAMAHLALGERAQARELLERSLALEDAVVPPDHPIRATSLAALARLESQEGHPDSASALLERALAISRATYGEIHPEVAGLRQSLAELELHQGDFRAALAAAVRAEDAGREHARLTAQGLPERRALALAGTRAAGQNVALAAARALSDTAAARMAWDALVRSRGLVLNEMASRHRALNLRDDEVGDSLWRELGRSRARLANLSVRVLEPPAEAGDDLGRREVERLRRTHQHAIAEKERLEQALAERSIVFRRDRELATAGYPEIARELPRDAALVAFVRYEDPTSSRPARALTTAGQPTVTAADGAGAAANERYAAFVLRAGGTPRLVDLGEAPGVDSAVKSWQVEVSRPGGRESTCRRAGEVLRKRVWDPVSEQVSGVARIYVVPDGTLNLVSLATLPAEDHGYLVERGPTLHYLSAERDLSRPRELATGNGLVALGDPAFDARGSGVAVASAAETYRGTRSACPDFTSQSFEPLPATAMEVRDLLAVWPGGSRKVLLGPEATEAEFKTHASGHRVLHLATHGFFLGGECRSALAFNRGMGALMASGAQPEPSEIGENPLLLSGLALAGANRRNEAGPDEEDGILTAEEIASLDLSGVEWAVLSACETGVGEVRAGEGVFGLRRAFQIAGARTLIMSLWSVEDEATRAWMGHLYRARLVDGLDTAESVRAASLAVLKERRARGESTHPFYWGAFVAAGDWR